MANYKKKKVKRIKPTKSNHPGKNHRSLTEDVKMQDSRIRRIEKRRRKLKTPNLTFTTKKPKTAKKNKEYVSEYKIIKGNKIKNKFKKILYYISCLFIIVVIICINYMTPTGLVETASNFIAKLGSGYDTAYLQSNKIIDFRNDHGRISVLSDTYLELYNNNSKQMLCYQHGFSTPQLKSSASRILVFDRGGKNFKVFNNSKLLLNESLENTIISADISRSGSIAFVTESTGYLAQVSVYNKGFKNKFTLYSSEKRISDAALNNNGNKIAVCEVLVENGVYSSIVSVY
ncbi:MAG: DUF5711 family protein, partial [bacterium]|nr:DUF5711 family protein [bacterium]